MKPDTLLVERKEGVVTAILNRPDKLNALNKELVDDLNGLLELLETDRNLRVLVITGAGEKAFSAGLDLKEQQGMNEKDMITRLSALRDLYSRLEKLPVPVIAAVEGLALGAGFELVLCCDLRVASTSAILGFPEATLGVIPGCGGTQRLSRLVGMGKALELVLLATRISGKESLDYGIVNLAVAPGTCRAAARQWVTKLMEAGPVALREAKYVIRGGCNRELDEGLKLEFQGYKQCLKSSDRLEGIKAFVEKRKPVYLGK